MHGALHGGKKRNMSTFYTVTLVTTNQDVFLCNSHIPDNLIADKAQKGRT